ncbi:hypothetical protein FSARC_11816 [Fusarium sarcochroum]|uniref:HMA domain-containing protein n=1 Tax=Fusarium sarcochroum TaxID=1208366 RepID=A0A8H4TD69_9HYPO|nr:hypothetical protein FSARC_11816 [Fusarium sarcochroum]
MACCYIAAFCISQLVKVCQFLDADATIRYNEDEPEHQYSGFEAQHGEYQDGKIQDRAFILSLSGLTCAACSNSVESALGKHPQVDQVRVSLALQQATVIGKTAGINKDSIKQVVLDLGYDVDLGPRSPQGIINVLKSKEEIARLKSSFSQLAGCASVIQLIGLLLSKLGSRFSSPILWVMHLLCALFTLFAQYRYISWIHVNGWKWLGAGRPNMDTLISSAISLGTAFSFVDLLVYGPSKVTPYYTTMIGLALVVVSGRYLETMSRRTASEDLIRVYKPLLENRYTKMYSTGQFVPQSFLRPSDVIVIEPFATIPCDCYVTHGSSSVNQAIVTGESMPVKKNVGDFLLGGTRNLGNEMIAIVHKEQARSFYAQLVQGAVEASGSKADDDQSLDIVMKYFVLCVLSLAVLVPLKDVYWSVHPTEYETLRQAVIRSMTILTCACPCALGLAIPSAVVAAANVASQKGILITKGFLTIKKLNNTQCIVFDKTGTLTQAKLDISSFDTADLWTKRNLEFWTYVCAVEEKSVTTHPLSRAIFSAGVAHLNEPWLKTTSLLETRCLVSEPGNGVSGEVSIKHEPWRRVIIGNLRYLHSSHVIGLPEPPLKSHHEVIEVYVGIDGTYAGTLSITDIVRPDAGTTISQLKTMGYQTGPLTGDLSQSAQRVSELVNMPVLGFEARPQDKLEYIKTLQADGSVVTMVGDGLNDAPSLAAADVGITLYHEAATATVGASVVILNTRLDSIPLLLKIAKRTMRQVRFNLAWVFTYNIFALSIASGFISPFGIVLTPPIAAALMSFSSIMITMNGLWLRSRLAVLEG